MEALKRIKHHRNDVRGLINVAPAEKSEDDEIKAEMCGSLGPEVTAAREEAFKLLADNPTSKILDVSSMTKPAGYVLDWWRTSTLMTRGRKIIRLSADDAPRFRQISSHGGSLLHHAAAMGNPWSVAVVVDLLRVDVNATDLLGRTPAHVAAIGGQQLALKALICRGADLCICDAGGLTPQEHAAARTRRQAANVATLFRGVFQEQDTFALLHDVALRQRNGGERPWGVEAVPPPRELEALFASKLGGDAVRLGLASGAPASPLPDSPPPPHAGSATPPRFRTPTRTAIATPSTRAVETAALTVPHRVAAVPWLASRTAALGRIMKSIAQPQVRAAFGLRLAALLQTLSAELPEPTAGPASGETGSSHSAGASIADEAFAAHMGRVKMAEAAAMDGKVQGAVRDAVSALPASDHGEWATGVRGWLESNRRPMFVLGSPTRSYQSFVLVRVPTAGIFPAPFAGMPGWEVAAVEGSAVSLRVARLAAPDGSTARMTEAIETQTCRPGDGVRLGAIVGPLQHQEAQSVLSAMRDLLCRCNEATRLARSAGAGPERREGDDGGDCTRCECDAAMRHLLPLIKTGAGADAVAASLRAHLDDDDAELVKEMAARVCRNAGACVCPAAEGCICPFLAVQVARTVLQQRGLNARSSLIVCDSQIDAGSRLEALKLQLEKEQRARLEQEQAAAAHGEEIAAGADGAADTPYLDAAAAKRVTFHFAGDSFGRPPAAGSPLPALAPRQVAKPVFSAAASAASAAAGDEAQAAVTAVVSCSPERPSASARDLSTAMDEAGDDTKEAEAQPYEEQLPEETSPGDQWAESLSTEAQLNVDDGADTPRAADALAVAREEPSSGARAARGAESGLLTSVFGALRTAALSSAVVEPGACSSSPDALHQLSAEASAPRPFDGAAAVFGPGWGGDDNSTWASPAPQVAAHLPSAEPPVTAEAVDGDTWDDADSWDEDAMQEQPPGGAASNLGSADPPAPPAGPSAVSASLETAPAAPYAAMVVVTDADTEPDAPMTLSPSDGTTPTGAAAGFPAAVAGDVTGGGSLPDKGSAQQGPIAAGTSSAVQPAVLAGFADEWLQADEGADAKSPAGLGEAASLFASGPAAALAVPTPAPLVISPSPQISRAVSDEVSSFFTPVSPTLQHTPGPVSAVQEAADASAFLPASPSPGLPTPPTHVQPADGPPAEEEGSAAGFFSDDSSWG